MDPKYLERLIRRVESVHPLDEDDKAALRELPLLVTEFASRQHIVREGDRPTRCCIVFEGMTCWYKMTGEGKRQILAFQIPGDIPDLQSLHLPVMDCSLMTMGPCTVGFVAHEALIKLCELRPNVAHAFWRITLIDAAIFREWVANGSRQGVSRMAHMFCEQAARLGAVGLLGKDFSFQFPVTQNEIGDAMGLSTVHVNRSLQELRQKRLVRFDKFTMKVIDWAGLQDAGDFDPAYLFLTKPYLPAGVVASAFPVSIGRKI